MSALYRDTQSWMVKTNTDMPHIFAFLFSVSCPQGENERIINTSGENYSFFISYNSKPQTDPMHAKILLLDE